MLKSIMNTRSFRVAAITLAALAFTSIAVAQTISIVELSPAGPVFTGDTITVRVRAVPQNAPAGATARVQIWPIFDGATGEQSWADAALAGGEYLFEVEVDVPSRFRCFESCSSSVKTLSEAMRLPLLRLDVRVQLIAADGPILDISPTRQIPVTVPEIVDIQPVRQPLHSRQLVRITVANARFSEAESIRVDLAHATDLNRLWTGIFRPDRPDDCKPPGPWVYFIECGGRVISDTVIELSIQSFAELVDQDGILDTDHIGLHDLAVVSFKANEFRREAVRLNAYTFDPPLENDLINLQQLTLRIGNGDKATALPGQENQYPHDFVSDPDVSVRVEAESAYRLSRYRSAKLWLLAKDESTGSLLQVSLGTPRLILNNSIGETLEPSPLVSQFLLPNRDGYVDFKLALTTSDIDYINNAEAAAFLVSDPIRVLFGTGQPLPQTDAIVLSNSVPPNLSTLESESHVSFVSDVTYSLETVDDGFVELRVADQSGAVLATARQAVSKGSGQITLTTVSTPLPPGITGVALKGVLLDSSDKVLASADGASYSVQSEIDVEPRYIEVVQSVQDANNNVRLVANKQTLARVFIGVGDPPPLNEIKVEAILHGFPAGSDTPLPGSPLSPIGIFGRAPAKENHDRGLARESVNFLLPKEWTSEGSITLVAEVDPAEKLGQEKRENNYGAQETVKFFAQPRLYISALPICVTVPGADRLCPGGAYTNSAGLLNRAYPVADDGVSYSRLPIPPLDWDGDLNEDEQLQGLLNLLRKSFALYRLMNLGQLDQVAAWVDRRVGLGDDAVGLADPKGGDGTGRTVILKEALSERLREALLAHEIGHNFGLRHPSLGAESCDAEDAESDWPFQTASIQEVGYDPKNIPIILSPNEFKDMMSYCSAERQWISEFHFDKLFDSAFQPWADRSGSGPQTLSSAAKTASEAPSERALNGGSYLLVSGSVRRDGGGATLDPAYRIASDNTPEDPPAGGAYCLDLRGDSGTLATYCFDLTFKHQTNQQPMVVQSFAFTLPDPGGVQTIVLREGSLELAILRASAGAPRVAITEPAAGTSWSGGNRTIRWNATDSDGGSLTYSVLYSADGGANWLPVAIDTTDPELTMDVTQVEGTTNGMFRVLASDGLNTGEVTVGPVTIEQSPQIAADPAALDLGSTPPGTSRYASVTVTNQGTGPLTISSLTIDNNAFQVLSPVIPAVVPASGRLDVNLGFTPAAGQGYSGTLTITSNAAGQSTLQIGLFGNGVGLDTPSLALNEGALDFGTVSIGASTVAYLAVMNSGTVDLEVNWSVLGQGFSLSGAQGPLTLSGGSSEAILVQFAPSTAGEFTGTLTIASNDPNRSQTTVALHGLGMLAGGGGGGPRPAINQGGIRGAASGRETIAPGSYASIFGAELAGTFNVADSVPFPTSLAGTQVEVNGILAPLHFVSAWQANFQLPFEVGTGTATVVVVRNGVRSAPEQVQVERFAPGFFTIGGTSAVIAQRVDGSIVTEEAPAKPGEALVFYVNGIGGLVNPPGTGQVTPVSPLPMSEITPTFTVGGAASQVLYAGFTPYSIGLGQVNAVLPNPLPPAAAGAKVRTAGTSTLPVVIDFGGAKSNTVDLIVEAGDLPETDGEVAVTISSVRPTTVRAGETIVVDFTITSMEPLNQQVPWLVYLSTDATINPLEDEMLKTERVDYLGTSMNVRTPAIPFPAGKTAGRYYVGVVILGGDNDSFGNNKSVGLPIELVADGGGADIGVTVDEVLPASPVVEDALTVRYTVSNPGGLSGNGSRSIYLSSDPTVTPAEDTLLNTRTLELNGSDAAIESPTNWLPENLLPGVYYIGVAVSFPGATNAANNVSAGFPIQLLATRPPFDLVNGGITVDESQVGPGDPVTVRYQVIGFKQGGTQDLSGTFERTLYLSTDSVIDTSDLAINTRTFDIVEGNEFITSVDNFIPRDTPPGSYFIGCVFQQEGDTNPANNVSSPQPVTITVGRSPFDIGVVVQSVSPTTVNQGGSLAVGYSVRNTSRSSGIYYRDLYISTDSTISATDTLVNRRTIALLGDEPALTSRENTVPVGIGAGSYFVGVIVEMAGDTNPGDNVSTGLPVTVTNTTVGTGITVRAMTAGTADRDGTLLHDKLEMETVR